MEDHKQGTAKLAPRRQGAQHRRACRNSPAQRPAPIRNAPSSWRAGRWAGLLLVLAGLFPHAPLAASQGPPIPDRARLAAETRSRLAEIARDPTVEPRRRDFMMWLARHRADGTATLPAPELQSDRLRSSATTADDGIWVAIPPPHARDEATAVYDPVRDRMVVFGGYDIRAGYLNDVWVLPLSGSPAWSELAPAGTPPTARSGHTAIYDPVRDRMIVFGGGSNDVWELSLSGSPAWSQLTPAGTPPAARWGHSAIYDPVRDRMVVFGGWGNDVWALSLSGSPTWSEITPGGTLPLPRSSHTAIYDPVRDRMVVFGGLDGSTALNDVWALSLAGSTDWSELTPAGTLPPAGFWHTAVYDSLRDRMVVFGGLDPGYTDLDATWTLSFAGSPAWNQLAPAGTVPTARSGHTAILDPVRDRMVVFAGFDGNGDDHSRNDVWALSLAGASAWSEIVPTPTARSSHTSIYDPVRDRMLVFGGHDGYGPLNDVWALTLAASPAWSQLAPAGTPPPGGFSGTAIYDPVRDRVVVFVGSTNDVWALSLSGTPTWSALAPAGTPPAGTFARTAIYDPVRDRMVVIGGLDSGYGFINDAWALSLSGSPTWTALVPVGAPPTGSLPRTAIYDPARDRALVFGGYGDDSDYGNVVWALSLSGAPAWSQLTPAVQQPRARYQHTAIYDPVRDRMVVFAGYDGDDDRGDVWALSLAGSPAWSQLVGAGHGPGPRRRHTAIYDPGRDRMVVFGGYRGSRGDLGDVWALEWGTPVSDVAVAFDLTPNTLDLASQGLWVTGYLEPPSPHPASAIDIASIRLNGTVPVDPAAPTALGDYDGDGVPDLMVKFNRVAVELTVSDGDDVPVTVTGTVNGRSGIGTDHVRVRRALVSVPAGGAHLAAGSLSQVRWETPSGIAIESVALLQSLDGGSTWSLIAQGLPNTGSYDWTVPSVATEQAKVAVVLVESADETGYIVNGVLGVSEAFYVDALVGAGDRGPARLALAIQGAMPNPAANGRLRVEFALRDASPARLELVDVAGRVLTSKQVGTLGPGTHALDLSEGNALRPGIYFLRLAQGGSEVRARAAVIR